MENNKPTKRKHTVGYKTLKNVQMFEEFENKGGSISESANSFESELSNLMYDMNLLNLLQDEGYMDGARLADGVSYTDANDYIKSERNVEGGEDMFSSDDDVYTWVINLIDQMEDFAKKYKLEFK